MKKFVVIFAMASILGACALGGISGNGVVKEQQRQITNFEKIDATGSFDIVLRQGRNFSVSVKADENLLPIIETYVEGNTLFISSSKNIRDAEELSIFITAPAYRELNFSGAVEVSAKGSLQGDNLRMESSGASEMDMELEYKKMDCRFSGATEVNLRGKIDKVRIETSGASELDWEDLQIAELKLESSGASDIEIFVTDRLWVKASGASDISYRGEPKIERSDLSGAATFSAD